MRCLKCNNRKNFIIFGNQNIRADFRDGYLKRLEKEDFDICDIYPVICSKCQSGEVDFKYPELEEIFNKLR